MEKKNYERPVMGIETFVPNEFIAGCTIVIDKEYEVDPNGLKQGIHVKYKGDVLALCHMCGHKAG